jgi:hypothetical protein
MAIDASISQSLRLHTWNNICQIKAQVCIRVLIEIAVQGITWETKNVSYTFLNSQNGV